MQPRVSETAPVTAPSVSMPETAAPASSVAAKTEAIPSTLAALFDKEGSGSFGLGGIMGLRGLPKLPSFRVSEKNQLCNFYLFHRLVITFRWFLMEL